MLKVKESAIKTMAGAASAVAIQAADATQAPVNSTAIVLLNKKLRVGFGFSGPIPVVKPSAAPLAVGKTPAKPLTPKIEAAPIKMAAQTSPAAKTAPLVTNKTGLAAATPETDGTEAKNKTSLKNEIDSILGGMGVKAAQPSTPGDQDKKNRAAMLAEEAKRRGEEQKKKLDEQRLAQEEKEGTSKAVADNDAAAAAAVEAEKAKQKEIERQKAAEEARLAEEKKKREEAARLAEEKLKKEEEAKKKAEEEKKRKEEEDRKKAEEEKKRLAEEAKKKAEEAEAKKKEEERLAAQEKLRLEKLRIQEERLKVREERRQKLAQIEKERRDGTGGSPTNDKTAVFEPKPRQILTAVIGDDLGVCLRTLLSKLRAKQSQFEKGLLEFPEMRKPLEQKKDVLRAEIDRINSDELSIVERNEREIESKEAAEKAKLSENMDEQLERTIEQKLWAIEDQRKEIEKQRWAIEDQINKILAEIEVINSQIDQKCKGEESLKQDIKKIANQEKLVEFCLEKNKLEDEILREIEQRDSISPVLDAAEKRKFAAKEKFQELTEKESTTKAELEVIEQQEKQETDVNKKRLIEQSRWKANSSLKNTIQTKWEAEEKLKNVSTETQTLQTKINTINEKIDKVQADIATREALLEGEGLPIRKMREAITQLFLENGLEIDSEILKDIVQYDEPEKAVQTIKINQSMAASAKPAIETGQKPLNHQNGPAAQGQPATAQIPSINNTKLPIQTGNLSATAAQPQPAAGKTITPDPAPNSQKQEAPVAAPTPISAAAAAPASIPLSSIQKPAVPAAPTAPAGENAATAATEVTKAEKPEEKIVPPILKPAEQKVPGVAIPGAPISAAPAAPASMPLSSIQKPAVPAAPTAPAGENAATTPVPPATPINTANKILESSVLARPVLRNDDTIPENQLPAAKPINIETKKDDKAEPARMPETAAPKPAATEPAPPKESDTKPTVVKTIDPIKDVQNEKTPYREPITVEPATNFRDFSQRNFGGAAAAAPETVSKPAELEPKTPAQKIEEKPLAIQEQGGDVWQDRWGQIKKNTTPGASAAGTAGPAMAAGAAGADMEGAELEKPGGNKMMVRILVVLLVVAVIGIALALILTKNNSPAPTKKDDPTKTDTTKTGSSKDDSPDTGNDNRQLTTLATVSTIPIVTDDLASVPNLILPYTKTTLDEAGYHKITIQNKKNNTYVGLRQFLNIYKINAPSAFYSSVNDDFILFIYANKTKNRIGFATQINDEQGIKTAMNDWEEKMVSDTNNFYNLIGRKTQDDPDSLEFKSNTASNGTVYRSLTFAPAADTYTISYAIYNSKWLIFTTSEEALIKIFDQLPK